MRTRTTRWGNSIALRVPKAFAEELGLHHGAPVEMTIEAGRLVVRRIPEEPVTLEALLAKVTDDTVHSELASSGPVGTEIW
jgi:antitoxin MazE